MSILSQQLKISIQLLPLICMSIIFCVLPVLANDLEVKGALYQDSTNDTLKSNGRLQSLRATPGSVEVAEVTLAPLSNSRSLIDKKPGAYHIGVNRNINQLSSAITVSEKLKWTEQADGGNITVIHITSPAATAVRLGFKFDKLPLDAELRFYELVDSTPLGSAILVKGEAILNLLNLNMSAEPDNPDAAVYWSPTMSGESAGVEIYLPAGVATNEVEFSIPYMSHLVESPFTSESSTIQGYGDSNSCQNDATCSSNWSNIRKAVAKMIFTTSAGSYICTGTMLNDKDTYSWIPYFISANHCVATQSVASTLETLWYYESSSCNGYSLHSNYQRLTGGAKLLWTGGSSSSPSSNNKDTSFFRLNDSAPSGVYFAGWNAAAVPSGGKIGVHHPKGDWKKISSGYTPANAHTCWTTGGGYFSCQTSTNGSFVRISWVDGGTEGGSSGSGLFHNNDQLIGDLKGGGGGDCAGSYSYYSTFRKAFYDGNLGQWLNVEVDRPKVLPGVNSLLLREVAP